MITCYENRNLGKGYSLASTAGNTSDPRVLGLKTAKEKWLKIKPWVLSLKSAFSIEW